MPIRTSEVFGVSRDVPMNYVTRSSVDGTLVDNLTRDKHVVIYGSSKQGKTCLRKYNLTQDEYEVVTCSNKWKLAQLHTAILKQAGFEIEQSRTRTETGANKISAKARGGFNLFGYQIGGEAGIEDQNENSDQIVSNS